MQNMYLLIILIALIFAFYIYTSFAFRKLARRTNTKPAWLAWLPIVGKPILSSRIAQMHWWPILFLVVFFIPLVNIFTNLAFGVFYYIWLWKTFKRVNRPGWWPLLSLIPFIGGIIFLVLLGIATWGKEKIKPTKSIPVKQIKRPIKIQQRPKIQESQKTQRLERLKSSMSKPKR